MKTITEYQPLIFGLLLARAENRGVRRNLTLRAIACYLPALYVLVALGLILGTGLAPWDWPFWMVFTPFFMGSELALRELSRPARSIPAAALDSAVPPRPAKRPRKLNLPPWPLRKFMGGFTSTNRAIVPHYLPGRPRRPRAGHGAGIGKPRPEFLPA